MKVVSRQDGYTDPLTSALAKDVQAGFTRVPDVCICYATGAVWSEPFTLSIPSVVPNETVRKTPPAVITCVRAVCVTDRNTLIVPGGVTFEWAGNGRARIDAVGGLNPGVKYDLTFRAEG